MKFILAFLSSFTFFIGVSQNNNFKWVVLDSYSMDSISNQVVLISNKHLENVIEVKIVVAKGSVYLGSSLWSDEGKVTLRNFNTVITQGQSMRFFENVNGRLDPCRIIISNCTALQGNVEMSLVAKIRTH